MRVAINVNTEPSSVFLVVGMLVRTVYLRVCTLEGQAVGSGTKDSEHDWKVYSIQCSVYYNKGISKESSHRTEEEEEAVDTCRNDH